MKQAYYYLSAGFVIGLAVAAGFSMIGDMSAVSPPATAGNVFNGTILLTGDVPEDRFIPVADVFSLPQADIPSLANWSGSVAARGVPVNEFLAAYGVTDYDRLVFYADDYMMAIDRIDVTDEMILVPDGVSVRVLGGNMPINSWAKGVRYVVVGGGAGSPALLNGRNVSYGSMLDDGIATMPFYRLTTGYRLDGREFEAETAGVAEGISLAGFLCREGCPDFSSVTVSGGGSTETLDRNEVLAGGLFLTRFRGEIRLAANDSLQSAAIPRTVCRQAGQGLTTDCFFFFL